MNTEILLPSSKSISNRILIINALSGGHSDIHHLSDAADTQDLKRCLATEDTDIFVGEGATTLRFLLAYYCVTNQYKILSCAFSLQQRPIKNLLTSLSNLGCDFEFIEQAQQLPLKIIRGIQKNHPQDIYIDAAKSSQFVSAILLIAPYLPNPIKIYVSNNVVSAPYIQMSCKLMKMFGVDINISQEHVYSISPSFYRPQTISVEADWSAACFFYAFLAILDNGPYFFPNLKLSGLQGDEILVSFFESFGIQTKEALDGIVITKDRLIKPETIHFDFTHYPDLFPAMTIFCALQKTNASFTGLQNLSFKESDRFQKINVFLKNQEVNIKEQLDENGILSAYYSMDTFNTNIPQTFETYNDHRLAMGFSLLYTLRKVEIKHPQVVNKSFPGFWEQLKKILPS